MNRYSVLLADDEEFVYDIIRKKMDWERMGFYVAGYARNGIEALEMAEDIAPDVIMTDIKMPYMDGLELCRRVKERFSGTKFIIFSGFDEFEYAKEAIAIEAEEYILKPIDAGELEAVFNRIHETLDKEIDEKRNIDNLQEYYLKSLPVLQENFYLSLLERRLPENAIKKYAFDYQIDLKGPYFLVSVLSIRYQSKNGKEMEVAPFLLSVSVQRLLEEQLDKRWASKVLSYTGDIVVISQLSEEKDAAAFIDDLDMVCRRARRITKANVTAGVGSVCSELSRLPVSYEEAKNAISYRMLYDNMPVISIEEIGEETVPDDSVTGEDSIVGILAAMKLDEKDRLESAIHHLIDEISQARYSLWDFKIKMMKLVVELSDFLGNYQIPLSRVWEQDGDLLSYLLSRESMKELGESLLSICTRIRLLVSERRKDSTVSFVARACEYIREHYSDKDIGIESVCGFLGVSSSYFSTAFKRATGKTFINYLTECRMKQAAKLLETTDKKTYIIADAVGYAEPNYFSYVFKKTYGCSPSKYRSNTDNKQ